jgi:hypothetical protein
MEKGGYRPASFVDLFEKIEPWKRRDPEPFQGVVQASDDRCPDPNLIWVWQIALLAFGDLPMPSRPPMKSGAAIRPGKYSGNLKTRRRRIGNL